jgi:acetylornithine aminotransferase
MGNGMPIGGVVARAALIDSFGSAIPYFNTFGGENVPIAAAQAVLDVIRDEQLLANAADKGAKLVAGMTDILARAGVPNDVRGAGLYIGVEFVTNAETKVPDAQTATAVVNAMKHNRVLISVAGPYGNVLKVRPPLVFNEADVDRFLTTFDLVTRELST